MRTPWIRRCAYLGLGLAVSSAVAVSGCGDEPERPVTATVSKHRAAAEPRYPLESYQLPDSEMRTILSARRVLEIRCMHRLGFRGDDFGGLIAVDYDETSKNQLLGFLDPAVARANGYHQPGDRAPAADSADRDIARDPRERSAMAGSVPTVNDRPVPQGGCSGAALRELQEGAGDLPIDPRLLGAEAQQRAQQDPRLRDALGNWRACMRKRGMKFDAPWLAEQGNGAWRRGRDGWYHTDPTRAEKLTATADAECRADTNLLDTWITVQSEHQNRLIAQHRAELEQAKRCLAKWLDNAARAVREGP